MADGTVKILTDLSTEGFKKGLSKLGGVAKTGLTAVTTSVAAAGAALGGMGAYAVKVGSDFETSMSKASTLFGDVAVDTDALNDKVLKLSGSTGIAASEIGNSLYNALSAGIPATQDMAEAMDYMEDNARLAKAGFTDIDTAVTATAKVLNAYKLDVSETDRVHRVLMQTQNKGITTVGELGSVLAQVTPTAAAMNVSFEQVGAALATMTAQGTPTAQATTQLNSLFAELGKKGTIAQKSLESAAEGTKYAGMSFQDMMAAGIPLNEVLDLMGVKSDMTDQSLLDMFGSIEAGKAALSMSGKNSEQFTSNLEAMGTTADVVGDAYNKMADTLDSRISMMRESLNNLGISISKSLQEPLKEAVQTGTEYLGQLQKAFDEGGLSGAVSALGDIFADVAVRVAEAAPKMIDAAVSFITNFLDGLEGNLPQLAASAVSIGESLLSGLLEIIPQVFTLGSQFIVDFAQGAVEALPQLVEKGVQMVDTITQAISTALPQLLNAGMEILAILVTGIAQSLPELIPAAVDIIMSLAASLIDNLPMLLNAALKLVQGLAKGILNAIPVLIAQLPKLIQGIVDFLVQSIPMLIDTAIQLINGIVAALPEIIQALIDALPQIIESLVSGLISCTGQLVAGAIQLVVALVTHLPEIIAGLIAAIPEIITAIVDGFISGLGAFIEAGGQIIDALGQGISDAWDSIVNYFTVVIPNLIESIGTWFSELPGKVGQWLTATFNNVVSWASNLWNKAREAGKNFIDGVINFVKTLPQNIWNWLQNVISKVTTFATNFGQKAMQAGKDFFNNIVNTVKEIPGKMLEIGGNIVSGIWNGISGAAGWLWDQICGFCNGIVDGIKNFFGIHSPSRLMAETVGCFLPPGIAEGFEAAVPKATDQIQDSLDGMAEDIEPPVIPVDVAAQIKNSGMLPNLSAAVEAERLRISASLQASQGNSRALKLEGSPIDYERLAEAIGRIEIRNVTELDGKTIAEVTAPLIDKKLGVQSQFQRRFA